jgi:hypothetical protein
MYLFNIVFSYYYHQIAPISLKRAQSSVAISSDKLVRKQPGLIVDPRHQCSSALPLANTDNSISSDQAPVNFVPTEGKNISMFIE